MLSGTLTKIIILSWKKYILWGEFTITAKGSLITRRVILSRSFILSIRSLSKISKTIIFVANISRNIILTKYLYTKLLDNLKDKSNQIIQYYYSNLLNELKKLFTKDFF